MINIAVDGPAGAGKSTVCKQVAKELGYIYIDTGAMYRAVAYYAMKNRMDCSDFSSKTLDDIKIEIQFKNGTQYIFLCGENVTDLIRTPEISSMASAVSANKAVREFLLSTQREMARKNNALMDGRDIGTVVLPNADVKIYLTASTEKRAERRYKEFAEKGIDCSFGGVLKDIQERDYNDSHRKIAPLKPARDAIILDTGDLTFEESVKLVLNTIKEKIG